MYSTYRIYQLNINEALYQIASLLEQTADQFWDVLFRPNFVIYLDNIFNV